MRRTILAAVVALAAFPAAASEPADAERYPYVAAFSRVTAGNRVYFCTGALIQPRWILTAAHCFHNPGGARITNRNVWATVGQDRLDFAGDNAQVAIDRVFVHPGYDARTQHHDIALVRLADEAGPLIAEAGAQTDPPAATILGFGSYYEGGLAARALTRTGAPAAQLSDRLRRGSVRLVDPARCAGIGQDVDYDTVCGMAGPADACIGDSGGPLVEEVPQGLDRLVGLVSIGSGCAVAQPVVRYTRVDPYLAWIDETIQQTDEPIE